MDDEIELELHCDGDYVASALGPRDRAWQEIMHYASQYATEGQPTFYEVSRVKVEPPTA